MYRDKNAHKIHILCSYYNRPILVKNALNSILAAHKYHQNWRLTFGDDNSPIPGRPIVETILKEHLDKVTFIQTGMTFEDKIREGISLGKYANKVIAESDADVFVVMGDDDELHPEYLMRLSDFFSSNPQVLYCYSKLYVYNPLYQKSADVTNPGNKYNQWWEPIVPMGKVDATQVAWRRECCVKYDAWFVDNTKQVTGKPWARDTDISFFDRLYLKCGLCHPTGIFAQYKGIHDYQLLWHKNVPASSLWAYDQMVRELGGVIF